MTILEAGKGQSPLSGHPPSISICLSLQIGLQALSSSFPLPPAWYTPHHLWCLDDHLFLPLAIWSTSSTWSYHLILQGLAQSFSRLSYTSHTKLTSSFFLSLLLPFYSYSEHIVFKLFICIVISIYWKQKKSNMSWSCHLWAFWLKAFHPPVSAAMQTWLFSYIIWNGS